MSSHAKALWEFIKYKIRSVSITYSKKKAKVFCEKVRKLEQKVCELEQNLSNLENSSHYEKAKKELEECYTKITEGIIV